MNKLVSLIVPVYNASDFLDECIKSIINQTYHNIEIILIDDYSQDDSYEICKKYASQDGRITVLQTLGKGVSDARNTGIKIAKGEYIGFLDSDDSLDRTAVETLIHAIVCDNSQLVVASYNTVNGNDIEKVNINSEKLALKEYLTKYVSDREYEDLANYPWNKFYVANIIKENKVYFESGTYIAEDAIFNMKYLQYTKEVSISEDAICNHFIRENSLVNSKVDTDILKSTFLKIFEEYKKCFEINDWEKENIDYIGTKLLYYFLRLCSEYKNRNTLRFIKEINIKKFRKYIGKARCINLNYRIFKTLYILRFNNILYWYTEIKRKIRCRK